MSLSMEINIISYSYIKQIFDSVNFKMDISQFHGYLSGYICSNKQKELESYITSLKHYTGMSELIDKIASDILNIYQNNIKIVEDENLTAQLVLPDIDTPLQERIQALGLWCQGFIDGFYDAITHDSQAIKLTDDTNELLADLSAIGNIDYLQYEDTNSENNNSQTAETDLFNISEFVKISWISLYLENRSQDNSSSKEH